MFQRCSLFTVLALSLAIAGDASGRGMAGGGGRGGGGGGRAGGGASRGGGGARPSMSVPQARPSGGMNRPNMSQANRPATSRPGGSQLAGGSLNRPTGGMKPTTRPAAGATRPSTTPGNLAGNRPTTRPATSIAGLGDRPGAGNARPNINTRPGVANRPSAEGLGDFLGMQKPIRPGSDGGGIANTRPGDRPGPRPANRPGNRPGEGFRPNINIGNNVNINNRPSWANIRPGQINNINNNWQNAIGTRPGRPGMGNWLQNHPDRLDHWQNWANNVPDHWGHGDWFNGDWWQNHNHDACGWHYCNAFHNHGWDYWWTVPAWAGLTSWFTWSAPETAWSEPMYYDYGSGGNVTYTDNSVYVNGQPVATAQEFAQSAAALATVPPPKSEQEGAKADWMPLGTFAVSTDPKDTQTTRVLQLAVSKEGIISGTLYNTQTDKAQTVQGQVDKQTQRVALRFGDSDTVVAETGLYNLTQDQAPMLVHFGADKVENYLLVRLKPPEEGKEA